jgi:hypothetical protein
MKKLIICIGMWIIGQAEVTAQVFTLVDSIQYTQAQIWGVVSDQGDSLVSTTLFNPGTKPHIYLRKNNYTNISQQSSLHQLTFDTDFTSIPNLTDHKSIILNNQLFVCFSTIGDADLFVFKTDLNGNRIGSIVTVVSGSTDPTNDMIMVTDSEYIYILHFDPPNQHHVYTFDTDLNPVGSSFSTNTLSHNNIGNALFHNSQFYLLTGSIFGFTANLSLTQWDSAWAPAIAAPQNVVASSAGDGNWFSTGMIWDETNQRWYVGMNHISATETIGEEHIDLLAFDINFNLLERKHITAQGAYRPHFVLKNGYLYVSYDRSGTGVYLLKYQIANTTGIEPVQSNTSGISIYPNPAVNQVHVILEKPTTAIWLSDLQGRILQKTYLPPGELQVDINILGLKSGVYFLTDMQHTVKMIKE